MAMLHLDKAEIAEPWLVLESGPDISMVLVSVVSENRILIHDKPQGSEFKPGEFVWFRSDPADDEIYLMEATALTESGLRDFQQFAARYGLAYCKGISPKQGEA